MKNPNPSKPRLLFFLVLSIVSLSIIFESRAQVGFPYCENFTDNSTQSATVFGGNARIVDGALRLTDAINEQNGYIYINIPFSSTYGIKAEFEYFSYGGTGADGLVAFLFDAATPVFNTGGFGGSLGYAQRGNQIGLSRAYLGIGFDEYGNFGTTQEGKIGGFAGIGESLVPNSIVIRGPGNGLSGYGFVVGRKTMLPGNDGLRASDQFPISSGGPGTNRITDPNLPGYRKVFLDLQPDPFGDGYFLTVRMLVSTETNNPRMVTIFDRPYNFPAPKDLKIGFTASTGGLNNIHEIRNLIVEVSNEDGLSNPEGINIDDKASCEGQENTYQITAAEATLPNENSSIRCLQFYGSLEDIQAEEGDICSQARCIPENRVLVLPQGTFRASDTGGEFTFFPNIGFTDQTVQVYYTITDNYGKTSSGNYIKLLIKESPEPVSIVADGVPGDLDEVRLCPGEPVALKAIGEENYVKFEWYRDNILIPDSDVSQIQAVLPGAYHVIAFNSKSCPTESATFTLANPPFPALAIANPVVGCVPGMSLDIRDFISGFDNTLYDYQLETALGEFLENEEMDEISQSGSYLIRIKHKDLTCWSEAVSFEVIIVSEALQTNFDFEVAGTGVRGDEDGGIFPDDSIQFTDISSEDVVSWSWDFGDGTSSSEQNPVHVYGKKGVFQIVLTVTDNLGCSAEVTKELSITKSYRVMFPTGFTPTLAENRFFRPKVRGIAQMEILIFNLWGNMLFRTNDLKTEGWDGKANGELMPGGNYVYRVKMVSIDGESVEQSGRFLLIR
ncbi:PKD domain-containing protein [Aquiflexum sp. LQ15W]|uniref:PKD domain-containing protein n=1 Tax=Cognataquiflexum nitidum TaxID=2922272 RepID=UPI001F1379C7|nr:PKD domain-containing protein [Cognataquiflexum nitidum]MCH6200578.1 PKD domain-containing protein [Cognataquiflexum nitidum]